MSRRTAGPPGPSPRPRVNRLRMRSVSVVAASVASLLVAPLPADGACLMPPAAAHRGSTTGGATENGLPAFAAGASLGARWIELDMRVTADRFLAVMHDPTVDRTTDGTGAVANMTLAQLRTLHLLDGSRVPTIREVFQWAASTSVRLSVEMKAMGGRRTFKRLLRQITAYDLRRRVVVKSFEERLLTRLRSFSRWVRTGLATSVRLSPAEVAENGGHVAINHLAVTAPWVARQHARGNAVHTWTPNDAAAYAPAVDAGVDLVITDRVKAYREYAASRCSA